MEETLRHLVADACAELGRAGERIGGSDAPRFELFHGANSICSQKVRVVLAHHAIPYVSHAMQIFTGETYLPAHVRLRMIGCDRLGLPLVTAHKGSTSVSSGGCDPAVVPTLIDWQLGSVMVDSARICDALDGLVTEADRLRPDSLRHEIDAEIAIVDNLPNYQMLAGRPPGEDTRPATRRGKDGAEFARGKVDRCDHYIAQFAGDPVMVAAYGAKRMKEADAAQGLFTLEAMQAAYDKAAAACRALDARLGARTTPWMFGDRLMMADLFWCVELLRIDNMGASAIWEDAGLRHVEAFLHAGQALPAIRSAISEWPGAQY